MNPFVGLSKVTKKRLDALENFTKEVESLKEHVGGLEATVEKNKNNFQNIQQPPQKPQASPEILEKHHEESTEKITDKTDEETIKEKIVLPKEEKEENNPSENDNDTSSIMEKEPEILADEQVQNLPPETPQIISLSSSQIDTIDQQEPTLKSYETTLEFNTAFIDELISSSFDFFFMEQNIEVLIDEYLHTLK